MSQNQITTPTTTLQKAHKAKIAKQVRTVSFQTLAISTILNAQLLVAAAIDYFGIMESEKTPFGVQKFIALALMIGSVVLFKWEPK